MELKKNIVEEVRKCVEQYTSLYVFSYIDLETNKIHEMREAWPKSRFLFGKNRIIAVALGRTKEDEFKKNLHKLDPLLIGRKGVFFTDEPREKVIEWFKTHDDYEIKFHAVWNNDGEFEKLQKNVSSSD